MTLDGPSADPATFGENDVHAMARALGLSVTGDDLSEVTHRLNAFVAALASLGGLPRAGPEPIPAPVDPDRAA